MILVLIDAVGQLLFALGKVAVVICIIIDTNRDLLIAASQVAVVVAIFIGAEGEFLTTHISITEMIFILVNMAQLTFLITNVVVTALFAGISGVTILGAGKISHDAIIPLMRLISSLLILVAGSLMAIFVVTERLSAGVIQLVSIESPIQCIPTNQIEFGKVHKHQNSGQPAAVTNHALMLTIVPVLGVQAF